jgi:teichoic acid transport system ATP-binding protein
VAEATDVATDERAELTDATGHRVPTVVIDDVHLTYRIAGRRSRVNAPSALLRAMRRQQPAGAREIYAIKGITLTAFRGDAIGLIGPNGSGKSTLLRGIAGLMSPDGGAIYTQGEPALLGVGGVLMQDMTGERNIELGCLAMGMSPDEVREVYQDVVDFAGLPGDFISLPMSTYSSGMGARLRFAIAAAKTREILLIDEALATGDAQFRRKSERRINQLREQAGTVFLVSHGLQVIRETCNRVVWLEDGLVVMDGPTDQVIDSYEDKYDPESRTHRPPMIDEGANVG